MRYTVFRQPRASALIAAISMLCALWFAACGSSAAPTAQHAGTPVTSTATSDPFASATMTPTPGAVCQGGPWGAILAFAGPQIPLPPLTVSGAAETFPPSGSYTGHYLSLCTPGNIDAIQAWVSQHMTSEGWSFAAPPGDCVCNGLFVWSRPNDTRLAQFEPNPAQSNGQVRWGVTVYTRR